MLSLPFMFVCCCYCLYFVTINDVVVEKWNIGVLIKDKTMHYKAEWGNSWMNLDYNLMTSLTKPQLPLHNKSDFSEPKFKFTKLQNWKSDFSEPKFRFTKLQNWESDFSEPSKKSIIRRDIGGSNAATTNMQVFKTTSHFFFIFLFIFFNLSSSSKQSSYNEYAGF